METIVDIVLLSIAVLSLVAGWIRGALVSAAALAGTALGILLALPLAPVIADWLAGFGWDTAVQRTITIVGVYFVCLTIVSTVLVSLAVRLRKRIGRKRAARGIDSVGGAAFGLLTWGVLVWLIAGFVQSTGMLQLTQVVASSRVVSTLNSWAPVPVDEALGLIDSSLSEVGLPRVFAGGAELIAGTQPPDSTVPDAVDGSARAIVRVLNSSPDCGSDSSGTGWVAGTDRIVTNAHVVAGSDRVYVQPGGTGALVSATLVVFDPERDLAVLAVNDLGIDPLPLGEQLSASDSAVVAGFPQNGPYMVESARIRQVLDADGMDIYGGQNVVREIYSLRGTVLPGNSGGPLLNTDGEVAGVVFAKSAVDDETGYALTFAELDPIMQELDSDQAVPSGACAE